MVAIPVISFASVYVSLPDTPVTLDAIENGVHVQVNLDQVALFGGVMALIYVAILAGISGFYVMSSAIKTDRRLILAGCTPLELVTARCLVLLVVDVGIMVMQLIIMPFFFTPKQILPYSLRLFWGAMVYGIYGGLFATLIRNELGDCWPWYSSPTLTWDTSNYQATPTSSMNSGSSCYRDIFRCSWPSMLGSPQSRTCWSGHS